MFKLLRGGLPLPTFKQAPPSSLEISSRPRYFYINTFRRLYIPFHFRVTRFRVINLILDNYILAPSARGKIEKLNPFSDYLSSTDIFLL